MNLLAILIAFGVFHWLGKPKILQSFGWWSAMLNFTQKQSWLKPDWLKAFVLLMLPVLMVAIISHFLQQRHDHQLWYLILNCVVLYYCLGPQQLEIDAKKMLTAEESESDDMQWLVVKLTDEAIRRWFLIIFWFVVLGVAGAMLSRLTIHSQQHKNFTDAGLSKALYALLSYPVIWLMTLSLLVASDFDRIWRHCKRYLKRQNWYWQHRSLLYEAMDFAVENCEIEDYQSDNPQTVCKTTLSVLKRMLMTWLVLVAFIVIFTIG